MEKPEATELFDMLRQKRPISGRPAKDWTKRQLLVLLEGRWSPKEIVSHLCGPEGIGMLPTFRAFLEGDATNLRIRLVSKVSDTLRALSQGLHDVRAVSTWAAEYIRITALTKAACSKGFDNALMVFSCFKRSHRQ